MSPLIKGKEKDRNEKVVEKAVVGNLQTSDNTDKALGWDCTVEKT